MEERNPFSSKKVKSNISKRTDKKRKYPERRISCKDLGQGDCEGWLWIKKISVFRNKLVRRWCLLKNHLFYFYIHTEDEKAEGVIQVQDFKVSPIESFRNNNFYFKIHNDEISFTFGSETQSDFTKWLNILQLSASNVEINKCEGVVGGFSVGYVRSASNTLKSDTTLSNDSDDSSLLRRDRAMSRYSESDESDVDSDKVSEEIVNVDSNKDTSSTTSQLRISLSAAERVSTSNRSTEELNELTMAAIKRIVEIERLIRSKKQMLTKIDQFLRIPATSERIREFWDDYREEIMSKTPSVKVT